MEAIKIASLLYLNFKMSRISKSTVDVVLSQEEGVGHSSDFVPEWANNFDPTWTAEELQDFDFQEEDEAGGGEILEFDEIDETSEEPSLATTVSQL